MCVRYASTILNSSSGRTITLKSRSQLGLFLYSSPAIRLKVLGASKFARSSRKLLILISSLLHTHPQAQKRRVVLLVTVRVAQPGQSWDMLLHMERAMTTSLDVKTDRPRRVLGWVLGGGAAIVAIGLLVAQSSSYAPTKPPAGATASGSEAFATLEPATLRIVPSPVIETNPEFFFGSGDGSAGYYAQRPKRAELLIEW